MVSGGRDRWRKEGWVIGGMCGWIENEDVHSFIEIPCSPCQHGVEEHTKAPDIDGCVISLLLQHLRGHKIGSVARGHQQSVLCS